MIEINKRGKKQILLKEVPGNLCKHTASRGGT